MRGLNIFTVLTVAVLLSGCAGAPPAPGASPLETANPSSSPSAAAPSEPVSRLGLTCNDMLPASLVASAINTGMTTTDVMVNPASATPLGYAVSQLGGLSCEAGVGVSTVSGGSEAGYSSVNVQILPGASALWASSEEKNPAVVSGAGARYGDASAITCLGQSAQSACSADILAGDTWIAVSARGINVAASVGDEALAEHVDPLLANMVASVMKASSPTLAWTAPVTASGLPDECSVYATADEFRALFGTTEEIAIGGGDDGEGSGLDNAAWSAAGVERCTWVPATTGQTWPLYVTALPGGAWAFDRSSALMAAGGSVQAVAEPLAGIDRATFGCHVYSGTCTLDTVIAGNWVQFNAETAGIGAADAVRTQLMKVAERAAIRFAA